jgi:uncharacterized protein (DUF433 family)
VFAEVNDYPKGITKTSGVCGGSACIGGTRIPVWVLEQFRRLSQSEVEILRAFPSLDMADLAKAWEYVRAHHQEIDEDIRQNEAECD